MLSVQNLTVRYGPLTVLDSVSLTLEEHQWLMATGPNGAGKSTLIAALSRSAPADGTVRFKGQDIFALRPNQVARHIGVLLQSYHVGYSFTVEEVVGLGRYAYSEGPFARRDAESSAKVAEAMAICGLEGKRAQKVTTLSGGELQRTFLAQALAQDPQILLLDEPTNHLDLSYQREVFRMIGEWLAQPGKAVLSVVHDLSLARKHGTHAIILHQGRTVAQGPVDAVFTRETLAQVYGMDVYAWMQSMLSQWTD